MLPRSGRELVGAVQARSLPRLKSFINRLAASRSPRLTVFVAGVHRSGTNMMMEILERSWKTAVFNESDGRAFDNYLMREKAVIRGLVDQSAAPVVVIKALHEAHDLRNLLEAFAPAKAIWMFRSFYDVVNSSLRRWPGRGDGRRNKIDAIVQDRGLADWRGLGMTDETHRVVCQHYSPNIDDASAEALFWVYRNQLFFDQAFDADPRVLLVSYERLVSDDASYAAVVRRFLEIDFTRAMQRVAHLESVRKHPAPCLDPDIEALCKQMQARLEDVHARGTPRDVPS
jgi:hypothetical protein